MQVRVRRYCTQGRSSTCPNRNQCASYKYMLCALLSLKYSSIRRKQETMDLTSFDAQHLFHGVSDYRERRLPTELAEACIDWLGDDLEALYACARVCRAWLPKSYSHRFRVLLFGDVTGSPGFAPPHATSIVCLLDYLAENRRVGIFVREFRLRARGRACVQLTMLRKMLSLLPHLLTCEVDALILNGFTASFAYPMRPYTPKALQKLVLRAPRTQPASKNHAQLDEILELFSEIEELHLGWQDPSPSQIDVRRRGQAQRSPGLKVARLVLDDRFPRTAAQSLHQLRAVVDRKTLRTLSCPAFSMHAVDWTALDLFLRDCGTGLLDLDIRDIAREADGPFRSLTLCPELVSFRLSVSLPVDTTRSSRSRGWDALCTVLQDAPASLRSLHVTLDPVVTDESTPILGDVTVHTREVLVALHAIDWSAIDRFLRPREKAEERALRLCILDKGFEAKEMFLLVAKQLIETKLTGRVRRYVDYELVSAIAVQPIF